MLVTDLNNWESGSQGFTDLGHKLASFEYTFLSLNESLFTHLRASEYFGKRTEVKKSYLALNEVSHLRLALIFMYEDVQEALFRGESIKVEDLYEKYSINCIKKAMLCTAGISGFDLIEAFDNTFANPDNEITEESSTTEGLGNSTIGGTFKIN